MPNAPVPSLPANSQAGTAPAPNQPPKPLYEKYREELEGKFTKELMSKYQWKFIGYPGFAEFMKSSKDFFLLRRFDKLNARVLLAMQDEIAKLEEDLEKIDHDRMMADVNNLAIENGMNGSLRMDFSSQRQGLLKQIKPLLKEYNDHVLAYSSIRSRRTADDRQYNNLISWLDHNSEAIAPEETRFKDHRGDLISIIDSPPNTPLGLLFEKWRRFRLSKLFGPRFWPDRHVQSEVIVYHSSTGKATTTSIIIVVIGLGMLFGPLWWLNWISDPPKRLGVITGFTIVFTALLMGSTLNRPFEVMAGTAAYAAVLMVFMQIGGN